MFQKNFTLVNFVFLKVCDLSLYLSLKHSFHHIGTLLYTSVFSKPQKMRISQQEPIFRVPKVDLAAVQVSPHQCISFELYRGFAISHVFVLKIVPVFEQLQTVT